MSTIDERIVSMKFNNTQFEAGIKTTLGSLEGLKKSLDFNASIKNLGDLNKAGSNVKLNLDSKQFKTGVDSTIAYSDKLKKNLNMDSAVKSLGDLNRAGKNTKINIDPAPFQTGVQGILNSASNLKSNMNFSSISTSIGNATSSVKNFSVDNVVTGLGNVVRKVGEVDIAGQKVSLAPVADGIDRLADKFDNMSVVGIAAFASLGVKAAEVGLKMAQSLFIDPAKSGLQEYETNINSIQTILANTDSKGTTLDQVNGALKQLNDYSDKTIYNFAEMAKNVGTFTSAGVDLDTSVGAIKGIANVAAVSGANSEQASRAMYQLSQAISSGTVKLQDWNSIEQAGMGNEAFKDSLLATAKVHGAAVDDIIADKGKFRESLTDGWLTSTVLTETLSKFTGDLNDDQLRTMGYNDEQIVGIQKMAATAVGAAQDIKTFSQLTGTLQEQVGSGWAETWKLVLGDFGEAKSLFTNIYNTIGGMQSASIKARNDMLTDWNKLGGRTVMIEAVTNAFNALMGIVKPIGDAFRTVFPPMTGQRLYDITVAVRDFTKALVPSEGQMNIIKNTFILLFGTIKIGLQIVGGFVLIIFKLIKGLFDAGAAVHNTGKGFGDFIGHLAEVVTKGDVVPKFFEKLGKGAEFLGKALGNSIGFLVGFISVVAAATAGFLDGGLDTALTRVRLRIESFGRLGQMLVDLWDNIKASAADLWKKLEPLRTAFKTMIDEIGANISNALKDVSFNDTLDMVNTGLLGGLVLLFHRFFKKGLGLGGEVKEGILTQLSDAITPLKGVFEQLTGSLKAMQSNLQADTLMKIGIAIGILTLSVIALSLIDTAKLTKALIAIAIMFQLLGASMKSLDTLTTGSGFLKMPFIAASMILLGVAILILAAAVKMLSDLSWGELAKGLIGVNVLLMGTSNAVKTMSANPANLIATGIGMIAIAIAIKILASAVKMLADLSWTELAKGLLSVSILLLVVSKAVASMSQNPANLIATGIGLIAIAVAIKILASAVSDFGSMDVSAITQGLIALGIVLTMLSAFSNSMGNSAKILATAIAMVVLGFALKILVDVIKDLGSMDMNTLSQGLIAMGIALGLIALTMTAMPSGMLVNAIGLIAVGFALKIIGSALKDMGGMSWDEIGKGLVTLGGSMLILAIGLNLMTGTIAGAAALLVAALAIGVLVPSLQALGAMTWDQIFIGLGTLAAVFILFGLAGLILAPVVPVILALGIAIGLFGFGLLAAGLGTLAFVTGLIALAAAGAVIGPVLVAIVGSILQLIPLALEQLGLGIRAFARVIGEAAPVFLEAFVTLIKTLLTAIDIVVPLILTTLWNVLVQLVALIVRAVPMLVDAGMKLIIGIVKGLADNIGKLIDEAARLIVEFVNGIGRNIGQVIDAGANLIVKFVQGLAGAVKNHSKEMTDAGLDLAQAIIEGMVNGVRDGIGRVAAQAGKVAESALDTVKSWLGIKSPSREFHKIGAFSSMGLANGIASLAGLVVSASRGVAMSALDTLKRTMSNAGDVLSSNVDMSPVIRPVLDLSAIEKDSGLINGMFNTPSIDLNGTYAMATALSVATRKNQNVEVTSTEASIPTSKDNITFVQNNYSPKALTPAEIYRQTKNQLSVAKGALTP